jgi:hypothetical protein
MNQQSEILALAKPIGQPPHTVERQAILVCDVTQIIVAALRPASTILQKQIGHFSTLPPAESCTVCDMRPAFRRGWVRGGKRGIVALARASGQSPPHGGGYFRFGNERVKPSVFPLKS